MDVAASLPLSFAQERLWFLEQLGVVGPTYNVPLALGLEGELDLRALERSFSELLERHESLRTRFALADGQPVQLIDPPQQWPLEVVDLSELALPARTSRVQELRQEEVLRKFDLSCGPLFRVGVLRLSAQEHVVLMTMHHIVSDGWSMAVLVRELSALYAAFVQGGSSPLAPAELQYADYALWQREWLSGQTLEKQLAYWKEQLSDAATLQLPTDRPRPAVQSYRGAMLGFEISAPVSRRLKKLGHQEGATLFMVLLAAIQVLLSRWSGQRDIVVGSPIAGRTHEQTEELIGFFVNMLVLRTDLEGDPSFREVLQRVKEVTLGAYAHQDVPFEKVVEALQPVRDLSRQPLFQVDFTFQNIPREVLQLPGLKVRRIHGGEYITSKFDLSFTVQESAGKVEGFIEYATDLFDRETIERLSQHLVRLLEGMAADPQSRISQLSLLSEVERQQLLAQWNETATAYPSDRCVHELFAEQVSRTPHAAAVIFEHQSLSYTELEERSNQLAHYLQSQGVSVEDVVGLCMERSVALVVAVLGILKSGGAYLPLDSALPAERLQFMLEDSGAKVLLVQSASADCVSGYAGIQVLVDEQWPEIGRFSTTAPIVNVQPDNLAYVIYTSGSTGRPKAVAATHGGVLNRVAAQEQIAPAATDEVCCQKTAIGFVDAVAELLVPLLTGRKLVVASESVGRDAQTLSAFIEASGVTRLVTVPSLARAWMEDERNVQRLKGLRSWTLSGEALSGKLLRDLQGQLPECRFINLYGSSEVAADAICYVSEGEDGFGAEGSVPIGRPIANTQAYVLDENLEVVPIGVAGELYIGGAGLARGYVRRAGLTAERFVPNPFGGSGERLYRMGDRVRWNTRGELEFLGRVDHQVKIRGFRIELGEVESVLLEHPSLSEAVVIAREDVPGDKRLVAYVVGAQIDTSELRTYLTRRIPEYMIPAAFVMLEQLPLSAHGKVDRKALPAPVIKQDTSTYAPPGTVLEQLLAQIWSEVLRIEPPGIHENFFELGGHSLLATQVVAQVRERLQLEMPLRALFESPTIAGLAEQLESLRREQQGVAMPALCARQRDAVVLASFAQERLWFLEQLGITGSTYNVPLALGLDGELDLSALERSVSELLERHESLRTHFVAGDGGQPLQQIEPPQQLPLEVVDLSPLSSSERTARVQALRQEEILRQFDLSRGPLFRVRVLRLSAQEHVVLMTMHHIVSDGWSMAILVRELSALYGAYVRGESSPLSRAELQYADYALWQRQWLSGPTLESQLAYWKEQLSGAATLQLPTDRPRPAVQSYRGATLRFAVSESVSSRLKELSRREGTTQFMVLLAAIQVLLSRWSAQRDIVVGSPIAGRTHRQTEGLIGLFVNMLALRTDLRGDLSFRELLQRVKEVTLGAYAHQDVPFEKVVEALQPVRDLSRQPLFQVAFTLQNTPQEALRLPALNSYWLHGEYVSSKFDLSFMTREGASGLQGLIEYATDLFDRETIERLSKHLIRLLERAVEDPQSQISQLTLLSEAERQQLLVQWNHTVQDYPQRCVHELFEEHARQCPDAVALVQNNRSLSYAELNTRANQLARHLQEVGVRSGQCVLIGLERSIELVIAELAILKAGGVYVPLDVQWPAARRAFIAADSGAKVMLCAQGQNDGAELGLLQVNVDEPRPPAHADENLRDSQDSRATAYVMYTSGSTGEPKGVLIAHRSINNLVINNRYAQFEAGDRIGFAANAAFDASTMEVWAALLNGACLVVIEQEVLLQPAVLVQFLREQQVNVLHLTAGLIQQCAGALQPVLGQLRCLLTGGDRVDPRALATILQWNPGQHLIHCYGPTETTTFALTHHVREVPAGAASIPIGQPIANAQVYILDEQRQPVPVGVVGELYIGGAGVARGYLNRAELTAERFVPNPYAPEASAHMYRTGDLGRWRPDGSVEFLGRNDRQVKIRGFRIELEEIEAKLIDCAGVREVVVLGREDAPGEKRLVAYVVGSQADAGELRAYLKQRVPEYMIPAAFVMLKQLPLTPNGKVDRQGLPPPERDAYGEQEYEALQGEFEEILAQIWQKRLRLERVGRRDNFFELGGHSLLATQVVAQVREQLQLEMPLRALFEGPTIGELAEQLETLRRERHGVRLPPLSAHARRDLLPLSFAQERLRFLDQLDTAGAAHNLVAGFRLEGRLDLTALQGSLDELGLRHESLRTRFEQIGDQAIQTIDPPRPTPIDVVDLTGLPDSAREEQETLFIRNAGDERFDLSKGPLFRVRLLHLAPERRTLLLTMHHIVCDGWSLTVLMREWSLIYAALVRSRPHRLAPPEIQYADFTLWQRSWLIGETQQRLVSYWKHALAGMQPLPVPSDRARPTVQSFRGSVVPLTIPHDLYARLLALGRRNGVTTFMVMLAAVQALLSRWSGQQDIVVGSPVAGRTHQRTEGLIGFLVNMIVLRTDLSGDPSFRDLLARVKEVSLGAYAHQDLPFEKVVEIIQPRRDLSRHPLFQVNLTFQNMPHARLELPELKVMPLEREHVAATFDLSFELIETSAGITGHLRYATDLFLRQTVERLCQQLQRLLDGALANPECPISKLPLAPAAVHQFMEISRAHHVHAADEEREQGVI